jgi:hypothetical protein
MHNQGSIIIATAATLAVIVCNLAFAETHEIASRRPYDSYSAYPQKNLPAHTVCCAFNDPDYGINSSPVFVAQRAGIPQVCVACMNTCSSLAVCAHRSTPQFVVQA